MAAPTYAQAWAKFVAAVAPLNNIKNAAAVNGTNFVSDARAYETTAQAENPIASQAAAALQGYKKSLNDLVGSPGNILNPLLLGITGSSTVASPKKDAPGALFDLYSYMAAHGDRITSRMIVCGPFVAGTNPGTGSFKQVRADWNGFPVESVFAEVLSIKCTKDAQTGAPYAGQEVFRLTGTPYTDAVEWGIAGRGSGIDQTFNGVSGADSLLLNAGLNVATGGTDAIPTGISGWVANPAFNGLGTDYQFVRGAGNYFQSNQRDVSNPGSFKILNAGVTTLTQAFKGSGSANITIPLDRPVHGGVAWNAQVGGGWTGTIQFAMGSKSVSVTVVAQAGWQLLEMPASSTGDLWGQNFANATGVVITVTKTSGAGTYLLLNRAMFVPYIPITDKRGAISGWILPVSGATPWLINATGVYTGTITITENASPAAVVSPWIHRTFQDWLPTAPATPTGTITGAASAVAGVVTAGNHVYAVSFLDAFGNESAPGATSANVNAADSVHKVDLANIPVGPTGTTTRWLYASKTGTVTPLFRTLLLSDNVATTASPNTADAGLLVSPSAGATVGGVVVG